MLSIESDGIERFVVNREKIVSEVWAIIKVMNLIFPRLQNEWTCHLSLSFTRVEFIITYVRGPLALPLNYELPYVNFIPFQKLITTTKNFFF